MAFAMVKKACATANYKLGLLDVKKKEAEPAIPPLGMLLTAFRAR